MRKYTVASARWKPKRGYWQVNVQVDNQRRSFYSSDPTKQGKREAESKAQAWADCGHGADIHLHDALDQWIASRAQQKNGEATARIIRKWFDVPPASAKRLSRLSLLDWQCAFDRAAESCTQSSLMGLKNFLAQFLSWCEKMSLPIKKVDLSDLRIESHKETQEKAILQPDELRILMSVDTVDYHHRRIYCWYINVFRLSALIGLRRGEALGLRWCDIDDHALRVCGSINDDGERTSGKTKNAQRVVALSHAASKVLSDQRVQLNQAGILSPYVFPDPLGHPVDSPRDVLRQWQQYTVSNGINPKVTLHGLRHTAISLYKSDMPLPLLKQVVGHSASMDTIKQYGHQLDGDARRSAEIMDNVLNTILGGKP